MNTIKKVAKWLAPPPQTSEDGRDQWPSRTSFVLASMGGCAGMGNLLRFPSQVYNNNGLQWFIPYLMAIFIIAIPVLVLEIAIGQAYRGGSVIAYNNVNRCLRGVGLSLLFTAFIVGPYFAANLSWIMIYFRNSFKSPLPWTGRGKDFYMDDVVANVAPILAAPGSDSWVQYPGTNLIGETVGWAAFTWFLVWLCIFRGVGLTGRVVYFTMGLPIIITIVLIGRSVSLPNAGRGIKLYVGEFNGDQLGRGQIWQTACGQVFFSTGVGFGYFISYASYNQKFSNAVMDSILIVCSNALFECIAAFAVFGVIGFLGMIPTPDERVGSFTIGFITLPLAVTEMPGANFWAVALFFTLMVLGFSSAFAMLDAPVTLTMDAQKKVPRWAVVSILVIVSFLFTLIYCTRFGFYLLDGVVDGSTMWHVVGQVDRPAFAIYNIGFLGAMVFGVAVAHAVSPGAGAGLGFGLFIAGTVLALWLAKTPDTEVPKFWKRNVALTRFYYLAFYSGDMLRHDLNLIVGTGKNWKIPMIWAPTLRYIGAPILAIVYSFSYPAFFKVRNDPMHIFGFAVGHIALVIVGMGVMVPRWFDVFVPVERRDEGRIPYAPGLIGGTTDTNATGRARLEANSPVTDSESVEHAAATDQLKQLV
ncbi:related to sodium-and chloride-dependent GABA transporter 1 [Rhynchosporium graminicola]|uniref:Related to sodium-and chloride-dependent GABA transporter 1 n=1 Tax=Rhynchosporium graminicola TaxID=2792576 RepID=A0A1E1KKB4_9HELO|nr:related to sodium-and chloride-dependent GABA transporter 1 [Rhynchosporium commune]